MGSPQRVGLIHAFFVEREAVTLPETRLAAPPHIETVGIVGGVMMGAGIAIAVLDEGLPVVTIERHAPKSSVPMRPCDSNQLAPRRQRSARPVPTLVLRPRADGYRA